MALHVRGSALGLLLVVGIVFLLREGQAVFVPILVSVLAAYALEPFVAALIHLRIPRAAAVVVLYLALAVSLVGAAHVARLQANGFIADLPVTIRALRATLAKNSWSDDGGPLEQLRLAAREVQATLTAGRSPAAVGVTRVAEERWHIDVRDYFVDAGLRAGAIIGQLSVIALLTFLLLTTGDFYKRKLASMAGRRREDQKLTVEVIRTIDRQIERYLIVRVLINVIVAVATGVALWWVGLAHAAVWGVIAGILNTLPFIGPTVAIVLITCAAFLQFHEIEPTMAAFGMSTLVAVLEGNLVSPWLTGRAGELNTVAVFVSVLFWGWMWGVWGLVLAVPITVSIKAAADHIDPLQPVGELLGR